MSKFVNLCLKDIEQGGLSPQWIIDNLNYIIGYAICHLEWVIFFTLIVDCSDNPFLPKISVF